MSTGRNDPCPCGSGKKYKHCCLNAAMCNSCGETKPLRELTPLGGILIQGKRVLACQKCIKESEGK